MIHCIGDSHSSVFSGKEEIQPIWPHRSDDRTPFFKTYRIGPATAYQLATKITIIDEILTQVNKETDSLLFCFGEVDIRAHLIKQMGIKNLTINDVVKECVDRYFDVVNEYKNLGWKIIVWGPIASWHESKQYTGGPSFGTCMERNDVTKEFNRYLSQLCFNNNIDFVTIFDKMVDENNETLVTYLDDWDGCHMHLSQRAMPLIIDEFNNKKLI